MASTHAKSLEEAAKSLHQLLRMLQGQDNTVTSQSVTPRTFRSSMDTGRSPLRPPSALKRQPAALKPSLQMTLKPAYDIDGNPTTSALASTVVTSTSPTNPDTELPPPPPPPVAPESMDSSFQTPTEVLPDELPPPPPPPLDTDDMERTLSKEELEQLCERLQKSEEYEVPALKATGMIVHETDDRWYSAPEYDRVSCSLHRREHELTQMTVHMEGVLRTREEDKAEYIDELNQNQAQLQLVEQELVELKARHTDELNQVNELLRAREEELATFKAQLATLKAQRAQKSVNVVSQEGIEDQLNCSQAMLKEKEAENLQLKSELHRKTWDLRRLEAQQEKELDDCVEFLKCLAISSSGPTLGKSLDLETAEILGMGNYGFVLTCKSKESGDQVVVKLQSDRWAGVAIKEWAHGYEMSKHAHIVTYVDALMHRDANMEIEKFLQAGFDTGVLTGRRPKFFPTCYFCLALEYMDRGTVQTFIDKSLLTTTCKGAITQQIASALSFMHKQKRTHNDIKPENILLRTASNGNHLIAKLADLGLASHSSDRNRDRELFAYTVWCMGLHRQFQRCPTAEGGNREVAIKQFQQAAPSNQNEKGLWKAFTNIITGLWQGDLDMDQIEDMKELSGLKIKVPEGKKTVVDLEASARFDVKRRTAINMSVQWKLCHSTSEPFHCFASTQPNLETEITEKPKNYAATWSAGSLG